MQKLADATDEFVRGEFRLSNGKLSGALFGPGKRYPSDRDWVSTWGSLGELLWPIVRAVRDFETLDGRDRAELKRQALEFAGDERACRPWLDEYVSSAPEQHAVGQRVLEGVVRSAYRAIHEARANPDLLPAALGRDLTSDEQVAAERLFTDFECGVISPVASVVGISALDASPAKLTPDDEKRTWLSLGSRMPLAPAPAMIYLSLAIGGDMFPNAPQTVVQPGEDFFGALSDPRSGLPPRLAAKFTAGERLMAHKEWVEDEADYFDSGIQPPGTTELDRRGFPYLFGDGRQKSVVVLAPTSAGKSRFGQLALIQTIAQKKRRHRNAHGAVVVLVPTKALVDQVARELRTTLAGTEAASWRVLEGSRDYPQHDEALRTGRFDVAAIIPEKLAALVRAGMSTERLPMILVDELQHIVDRARGQKLEGLLLDVFRRERVPRLIGLSASLAPETLALLKSWFSNNGVDIDFLQIESRPVPLTVSVVDELRRIASRTHVVDDRTITHRRLPDIPAAVGSSHIRGIANDYRRTLALLMEILKPHVAAGIPAGDLPSVLVFVRSKKTAESLADACRELLVRHLGMAPVEVRLVDYEGNDYRFAPFLQEATENDLAATLRLLPPTPVRRQLAESLATGVGFHSGSLTAVGRKVIEDLFRRGAVRILFATDTLRLGINLPADVVVNGDLVVYTGEGGAHFADKDTLLQRLGRAGRLLHSRGLGTGYLVTPERVDRSLRANADARTGELLTGRNNATWDEIESAATSGDALFKAYVADWSGGAHYSAPTNDLWFAEHLLQYLEFVPGRALTATTIAEAERSLFSLTLAAAAGSKDPGRAIETLEQLGAVSSLAGAMRLTDAGRAAAVNALGVGDLPVIQRIASEAAQGAGPLTLLYIACTSDFVAGSIQQLKVRPTASATVLKEMLTVLGKVGTASANPRSRGTFLRNFGSDVQDCFGLGAAAQDLRELLDMDAVRDADEVELTALWRALVVYLRFAGSSYAAISSLPKVAGGTIPEVALDTISGNAAYFLTAAADLLGVDPTSMHFRTLHYFAGEVELGTPAALEPLLRLNRPSLDRERVLGIAKLLDNQELQWDGLADLFRHYVEESNAVPRLKDGWHPLPARETELIAERLDQLDAQRRSPALSVTADIEELEVPGLGGHRVADVLRLISQGDGPQLICAMLEPFGVNPQTNAEERSVAIELPSATGQPHRTLIRFPDRIVDNALIDHATGSLLEHENTLVVAVEGVTFGAMNRSRFLEDPCAVISPALLVELIARLYQRNTADPDESRSEDPLDEIFGDVSLPSLDIDSARIELARLLRNNAPVLTRTDLENRLAAVDLVTAKNRADEF